MKKDLNKYVESFDRDRNYWNDFYLVSNKIDNPSRFAMYVSSYLKKGKTLLDIGCGNGRDSIYFAGLGVKVIGIDASNVAIDKLSLSEKSGLRFLCDDFVNSSIYMNKFNYCYSRFSLHAITARQEEILLRNIYHCLEKDGILFIETRSINDELCGKGVCVEKNAYVFNDHFRRFIVKEELEEVLKKMRLKIDYSEESRDFAPYGSENPSVIRIMASKINR